MTNKALILLTIIFSIVNNLCYSGQTIIQNEKANYLIPDTTIANAKLVEDFNDSVIWAMPNHLGYSVKFRVFKEATDSLDLDIIFFAPEIYGKQFFVVNKYYDIIISNRLTRYPFRPLSNYANPNGPFYICESIKFHK
jgi:hypothetical protein